MVDKRVNTACQVTGRDIPRKGTKKKKGGHRTGQLLKDDSLYARIWDMSESGKREYAEAEHKTYI